MTDVSISLVAHTNVGKTTLARTLLKREVGEVRDAPHVTEFADRHELIATADTDGGHRLLLWDTPGFGDSVRLARRMRLAGNPLVWFFTQAWDRWRDRAFWASQQALAHVRDDSDVVLYLVNAAEPEAGWIEPEMALLQWVGKPVIVLLNQLGAPRAAADEAAELDAWRARLARWPLVREVLPLDAFARSWVHEAQLLDAVARVLDGERAVAMRDLAAAWSARNEATFAAAMRTLAESLAVLATARAEAGDGGGLGARFAQLKATLGRQLAGVAGGADTASKDDDGPMATAQRALARALDDETRASTGKLLALHGLAGEAAPIILERVAGQFDERARIPEGRAAVLGGALTGALAGLKADIATGGLTLGGGLIAGGILGALGAAGVARGLNVMRGTDRSWAAWSDEALAAFAQAALLRYLAVIHFGRGRGEWREAEAPPHWPAAVAAAFEAQGEAWRAAWARRRGEPGGATGGEAAAAAGPLAAALEPLLADTVRRTLAALYPGAVPGPDGAARGAAAAPADNPRA